MTRNIVAFGGGCIVDPYLLAYSCSLLDSQIESPKICYLPTAAGDSKERIAKFYLLEVDGFSHAQLSHISLNEYYFEFNQNFYNPRSLDCEQLTPKQAEEILNKRKQIVQQKLADDLLSQHVIYIGGGNTANMLEIWKVQQVIPILRECYEKGIIICGSSAGGLCWFSGGITLSFGIVNGTNEGIGILKYRCAPHFQEPYRRTTARLVLLAESDQNDENYPFIGIDEGAAVHFRNEELVGCIEPLEYTDRSSAYLLDLDEHGLLRTNPIPNCSKNLNFSL